MRVIQLIRENSSNKKKNKKRKTTNFLVLVLKSKKKRGSFKKKGDNRSNACAFHQTEVAPNIRTFYQKLHLDYEINKRFIYILLLLLPLPI